MSDNKSIFKSASVISLATLCSRLLGFVRTVLIARVFGTGLSAEAFFLAFRIPNMLRQLMGEGAANSAIVPVFCEYRVQKDENEFWHLAVNVFWIMLIFLAGVSVLGVLFSRQIVSVVGFGFLKDPQKFTLTTQLARILFPYILFISLSAYLMGLLHAYKSFAAPALSSCMLNIAMIISLLFACRFMRNPIFGLAIGVLVGGLLQITVQVPSLLKRGFKPKALWKKPDFYHPGIKKIVSLLIPRIFGTAVYQLSVLVDTVLATFSVIVGSGAVAAIYFSSWLIQFPLGLFGVALSSAALPTLSTQAATKDLESLKSTLRFSLRAIYFMMLPAAFGLLVLAEPIIRGVYQGGNFGHHSVQITSSALFFYAMGLVFFAGIKILVNAFYALQDTRTPVKIAAGALVLNLVLNIILMFPLKVGGLALASSISAGFNCSFLYFRLKKKIGEIFNKDLWISFIKITIAGLLMAVFAHVFFGRISLYLNLRLSLGLTIAMAVGLYFGFCWLLKLRAIPSLLKFK